MTLWDSYSLVCTVAVTLVVVSYVVLLAYDLIMDFHDSSHRCGRCGSVWKSTNRFNRSYRAWKHAVSNRSCRRGELPLWQLIVENMLKRHIWSTPRPQLVDPPESEDSL